MGYTEFLTLIKQNSSKKPGEYKELCRFCLENSPNGVDIADNSKQQRNVILDNYIIITKRYLPMSSEYPNFVCSECAANLNRCALFVQQIEQNEENWELFLRNGDDIKIRMEEAADDWECKPTVVANEIVDIKMEFCDEFGDDKAPDTDTLVCDALELPLVEEMAGTRTAPPTATRSTTKRKRSRAATSKPSTSVNTSTPFERTCKHCHEPTFSSLAHMYRHHRLMHPGKKIYSCDHCRTEFITKHALCMHMNDRHATSGRMYQCQFCAKRFYSDREVKVHEKYHLNARSYLCNLCGKGFNSKTLLNVHLKSKVHNVDYKTIKHKQYPKKVQTTKKIIYRCEQCIPSTLYASSEERARHRNAVHKIYECDICKNSFLTFESLTRHKMLHSGKPRTFVCSVCDATFNQSSHLSSHFQRRHTDEKSVQCPHCDKSFFQNHELNSHVSLIHSKRKRAKCTECAKDFASVKYLRRHILNKHSTESPYDCKICGKKNGSASYLEIHRRKQHKYDI